MRIADDALKSAVFIARDRGGKREVCGSGFAVLVGASGNHPGTYIVTANHVLDGIGSGAKVYVRVNTKGGYHDIPTQTTQWFRHATDPRADVAVLPIELAEDWQLVFITASSAVTPELVQKEGIGPGDEALICGLFRHHQAKDRVLPVVRSGMIAAMPTEPVDTRLGKMDAYLIDAHSIGGASGSPVFAQPFGFRWVPAGEHGQYGGDPAGKLFWLGMLHGHFDDERPVDGQKPFNTGISIVIPAYKVLEVLNHPELVALRRDGTKD
jgi:S1-C subfamily serine protease